MQANAGPQGPMKANDSQRRPNAGPQRPQQPMQAHKDLQRPTKAQHRPTKVNKAQQRPTAANTGLRQPRYVFFFSIYNWLQDPMQAKAQCRPTKAHKGPQRPNAGQQRPTKANKGQQRPTRANKGQQGPTKAHSSQHRPMPAKWGPMQAYNDLGMFFFCFFVFFFCFYLLTGYKTQCRPMKAKDSQCRPTKANKGQKKDKKCMYENLYMCFVWFNFWNVYMSNSTRNSYVLRYRICIRYVYLNSSFWLEQHQTTSESMPL